MIQGYCHKWQRVDRVDSDRVTNSGAGLNNWFPMTKLYCGSNILNKHTWFPTTKRSRWETRTGAESGALYRETS